MRKCIFTPEERRKRASACALKWYYKKIEEDPEFKEKRIEKNRKWIKENPEGYKGIKQRINSKYKSIRTKKKLTKKEKEEKKKSHYQTYKVSIKARVALWQANNPEKIKLYAERAKEKKRLNKKPKLTEEQKKERQRNYYTANRERILSKQKKY